MLGLSTGYTVSRIRIERGSWCANTTLGGLKLDPEGLIVLGIGREATNSDA